jgi:hypothetical protein
MAENKKCAHHRATVKHERTVNTAVPIAKPLGLLVVAQT